MPGSRPRRGWRAARPDPLLEQEERHRVRSEADHLPRRREGRRRVHGQPVDPEKAF